MSSKQRLSASVDAGLVAVAQHAVAQGEAESVSAWVNEALHLKADHDRRPRALDDFLDAYEAEHGEITAQEMRDAARRARARAVVVRGTPARPAPALPAAATLPTATTLPTVVAVLPDAGAGRLGVPRR